MTPIYLTATNGVVTIGEGRAQRIPHWLADADPSTANTVLHFAYDGTNWIQL